MVLICISLMNSDAEYLCIGLLVFCVPFAHLSTRLFELFLVNGKNSLYVLDMNPFPCVL